MAYRSWWRPRSRSEKSRARVSTRSSAGFAGATDSWGRVWEGAVEAPSHDLFMAKGSLFLGRMTEAADGVSFLMEG
jgi:hypothetical protein